MEAIPRKYGEWGQFHRYCELVLYHEAIDYLREMKCRGDREVSLDAVSPADWDKLSTVDRYSSDSFIFSSHGYDLHIENELVAEAFASLTKDEQSILILRFVLDLTDEEIGRLMGMSRNAVQRHRTSTLKDLRIKLMALMPKGG
ncbi:sigma-70 family RNA polymerase sigma factor [bacterium 210917-SL.2.15]|nr:sigma-70 family RNA polymerase sigma factor [bacterium 210917-SL.2.15]